MSVDLSSLKKSIQNNSFTAITLSSLVFLPALSMVLTPKTFAERTSYGQCYNATFVSSHNDACNEFDTSNSPFACFGDDQSVTAPLRHLSQTGGSFPAEVYLINPQQSVIHSSPIGATVNYTQDIASSSTPFTDGSANNRDNFGQAITLGTQIDFDTTYQVNTTFDIPQISQNDSPMLVGAEITSEYAQFDRIILNFTQTEYYTVEHRNTAPVLDNLSTDKALYSENEVITFDFELNDLETNTLGSVVEISNDGFGSIAQSVPLSMAQAAATPSLVQASINSLPAGDYEWRVRTTESDALGYCGNPATNLETTSSTQSFTVEVQETELSGIAFLDSNGNNTQDDDELVFANSTLNFTGNNIDIEEVTDDNGSYSVTLPFGEYNVELIDSPELNSGTITSYNFTLSIDQNSTNIDVWYTIDKEDLNTPGGLIRTGGR